ncbi:MAG: site-2 protease family protein [Gemmatimonadota bacterium]
MAHEYAHARVALSQGDDTAFLLGRVTLNPVKHIDPWMTLLVPALLWIQSSGKFTFGAAKPVPVDPSKFRHYVRGDLLVSLAGVTTNLLISVGCAVVFLALSYVGRTAPGSEGAVGVLQRMMMWGIWWNLILCFFNLLPIPPLDGSKVFYHLLPPAVGARYKSLDKFGFLLLIALMLFGGSAISYLLTPARYGMRLFLRVLSPYGVGGGWNIFL